MFCKNYATHERKNKMQILSNVAHAKSKTRVTGHLRRNSMADPINLIIPLPTVKIRVAVRSDKKSDFPCLARLSNRRNPNPVASGTQKINLTEIKCDFNTFLVSKK